MLHSHQSSSKESDPSSKFEQKFLDNYANEWKWNLQEYIGWMRSHESGVTGAPKYILFDLKGEPLLPPLEQFPSSDERIRVLQKYWTTHYGLFNHCFHYAIH